MAIAYEGNTDLGFDTGVLRSAAREYKSIASDLRGMAKKLDSLLAALESSGWTTPAGSTFREMTSTNWKDNIEKYAGLLETLHNILIQSAGEYENLMTDYVRTTKVNLS